MPPLVRISEELAAYLQAGISVTVGTRDGELRPDGARAWAVVVHDDRLHVTAFLYERAAPVVLRNLESCPEIALAFDRPTDNRACQLKGLFVRSRPARPAEQAEVSRQVDGFLGELEALGIPRAMTEGWRSWPCVALELRVTHLYEQTPGPGAGEPMR
ncbi:MAG TPA: hypothetical protein VGB87_11875 [Vicinamibacteria bacterium]